MRPKPTFLAGGRFRRHTSREAQWVGEHAKPSDHSRDPELADLLQMQRTVLHLVSDLPSRAEVRATLEKLLLLDDTQQARAITLVDSVTNAELATGALRWYRRRIPTGALPSDFFRVELHEPPVRVAMIRLALNHLDDRRLSGRRASKERDAQFVAQLMGYWVRKHGIQPTAFLNAGKPSPFLEFLRDCFCSVGRKIKYDALIRLARVARSNTSG